MGWWLRPAGWGVAIALGAAAPAAGVLIDFETLNGGTPVEGSLIGTQFLATAGVTFALEGGGLPVLAQVGNPIRAFSPADTPNDLVRHGSFFLSDDGDAFDSLDIAALIVTYAVPTAVVSGDLIDVDFDEAFRIEARDAADQVLDTVVICHNDRSASCTTLGGESGTFTTGNKVTTPWSITRPQADIHSLRIAGERNSPGGFGLAFDNFDTGVVPEPAAGLLLAFGLACLRQRRG